MQKLLTFLFCVLIVAAASGQRKPSNLDRTVTLSFTEERLDVVLKKIGQQAGFTFSYKSSIIESGKKVTVQFQNKTVREVLGFLFEGKIQYKERGRYIILTKAEKSAAKEPAKVSGYIIDEATGQRLRNVSVYDPGSLASAITDSTGYFELEIKKPTSDDIRLAINKRNYADTLVVVSSRDGRLVNIPMRVNKEKINGIVDSVGVKLKRAWLATKKATIQAVNMENVSDTMYRKTQFSIVPFVGTHGAMSGNVINDFSLNVLGGYSLGVRKAEFGGLANFIRGDLEGAQFAGWVNGVMGKNKGVQFAGLANAVLDSSKGPQFAGLINFNFKSGGVVQMAGLANYTHGDTEGVGLAGLFNFNLGRQVGPHIAGLYNFAVRDARPAQLAGLFNFTAGSMHGAQIAGLFNYANDQIRGVQVAGLFNVSPKYVQGAQVAPFNFAAHVDGAQVGVINVTNSIKGIPIGLLSFVGKGYHKVEISADEVFYTNIAFRTGVRQFYNIITAGASPATFEGDSTKWTFGYGIGTAPKLTRWLFLNFDLTANQVVYGKLDELNMINKFFAGFDFQLSENFSLTAGITVNAHIFEKESDRGDVFADYKPSTFYERDVGSKREMQMWWGAKVGLRFL